MQDLQLLKYSLDEGFFNIYSIENLGYIDDINLALVLSCVEVFYSEIEYIRSKHFVVPETINICSAIPLSKKSTSIKFNEYYDLMNKVGLPGSLEADIVNILDKYRLSNRWERPLLVLIHTDILFLPDTQTISINLSDSIAFDVDKGRSSPYVKMSVQNTLSVNVQELPNNPRQGPEETGMPVSNRKPRLVIEVSEAISFNNLIGTLKRKRKLIEASLAKLQQTPTTNMDISQSEAFFWGQLTWIYKTYVDKSGSYGEAEKWMENKLDKNVPESRVLRTYYHRYTSIMNNFIP